MTIVVSEKQGQSELLRKYNVYRRKEKEDLKTEKEIDRMNRV